MTDPYAEPVARDLDQVTGGDEGTPAFRQLLMLQLASVAAFSVTVGGLTCASFCSGLVTFGGLELVPRVLVLSIVREDGVTTAIAACTFGLLVGTHRANAAAVALSLRRLAPALVFVALLLTPAAMALAVTSGFVVAHLLYAVPWTTIVVSLDFVTRGDAMLAALLLFGTIALNGMFLWFALPFMALRSWSLFRRIAAGLAVVGIIHISVAFLAGYATAR